MVAEKEISFDQPYAPHNVSACHLVAAVHTVLRVTCATGNGDVQSTDLFTTGPVAPATAQAVTVPRVLYTTPTGALLQLPSTVLDSRLSLARVAVYLRPINRSLPELFPREVVGDGARFSFHFFFWILRLTSRRQSVGFSNLRKSRIHFVFAQSQKVRLNTVLGAFSKPGNFQSLRCVREFQNKKVT